MFRNPIVPGFHPDPSVVRVGADYYLVTSSFEFFPGVPIFHSTDLVNWTQIGHCLTRADQLDLTRIEPSLGIFAPTIRHHDGTFYMITTNVGRGGNFFVTAQDPAGPWSDPVWIDKPVFDPSLLFDDDGTVYYTRRGDGGIVQAEIDSATGKLKHEPRTICGGFLSHDIEGPHLYKINGWYYLMAAEGGTRFGHSETIGRSRDPFGPFDPSPHNPIITHRDKSHSLIRDVGHAELVEDHNGEWWLFCLGTRHHRYDSASHLGRETFLCPVRWTEDGWPVVEGGKVEESYDPTSLAAHQRDRERERDDFSSLHLGHQWNFLRNPREGCWSLEERPGWLRLRGNAASLAEWDSPAFIGRRQEHFRVTAAAHLEFDPRADNEEAGLCVFVNDQFHYVLALARRSGARHALLRKRAGDVIQETVSPPLSEGAVELTVTADEHRYGFSYSQAGDAPTELGTGLARLLSPEVAAGPWCWTGAYLAMYSSGNGKDCAAPADFDWFEYSPRENLMGILC